MQYRAPRVQPLLHIVNIARFTGKSVAGPVRKALGVGAVPCIPPGRLRSRSSWCCCSNGRSRRTAERGHAPCGFARRLATVLRNGRFMRSSLTAGSGPGTDVRLDAEVRVADGRRRLAIAEWSANVNPLVVVAVRRSRHHLVRKLAPIGSIAIAIG